MMDPGAKIFQQNFENGVALCQAKTGDYGLSDLKDALAIQESVVGRKQHKDTGRTLFWIGRALDGKEKFEASLQEYAKAVSIQESQLGRYHDDTGLTYFWIGQAHFHKGDRHKALVAFRTAARIKQYRYGLFNAPQEPNADAMIQTLLGQGGCSEQQMKEHRLAMFESLRHEKSADSLRRKGDWKNAIHDYEKAAKLEEFAFGRFNYTLAFLWRKIACVCAIRKLMDATFIFPREGDLINSNWIEESQKSKLSLSEEASKAILRGDSLYRENNFEQAITQYCNATLLGPKERKVMKMPNMPRPAKQGGTQYTAFD
jgi:tetratricopeptide (TPR) repeat protein